METQKGSSHSIPRTILFVFACFIPHLLTITMGIGLIYGGLTLALPFLLLIAIAPAIDALIGSKDNLDFGHHTFNRLTFNALYYSPHAYIFCYLILLFLTLASIDRFVVVELAIIACSLSSLGVIGYAAAHEVLHKKGGPGQTLQFLATTVLGYPHYKMIHLHGHHKNAATPEDKNTAWASESFYQYLKRSGLQSMWFCFQHEQRRLAKVDRGFFFNKLIWFYTTFLLLLVGLFSLFGVTAFVIYCVHIVGAYVLLEAVNYIQHYGLLRNEISGKLEKLKSNHSWDMCQLLTSFMVFRSGLHSHHHIKANVPYFLLKAEAGSPKLPVSYPIAIVLVLFPSLWHRIMIDVLDKHGVAFQEA